MNVTSDAVAERADEIVVALDGSRPSLAALSWAVQQARSSGRRVCAVRVFDPTFLYSPPAPVFESIAVARAAEREALHREVVDTVGTEGDVAVREEVHEGEPAAELVRRSRGAAVLAMGSHGRGRVGTAFLGSVGAGCLRRAACPVLIIPPGAAGTVPTDGGDTVRANVTA